VVRLYIHSPSPHPLVRLTITLDQPTTPLSTISTSSRVILAVASTHHSRNITNQFNILFSNNRSRLQPSQAFCLASSWESR